MDYLLETIDLGKRYGALVANQDVNLKVRAGEIHAVMGENGAGKSTLMAMLFGLVTPTTGRIVLRGQDVRFSSPLEAIAARIGMVHQAFKLFPSLMVWQNIVFGAEPTKGGLIDRATACARIEELSRRHALDIDPNAIVSRLPIGLQQRVEILKALYRDAEILILDEPTAVLSPIERDGLLTVMRELAARGKTLLFVTHKLNEIMRVADTVTVMRRGEITDVMTVRETTADAIVQAMTGRAVSSALGRVAVEPGAPALDVAGLKVNNGAKLALKDVGFTVRAGEIVGIAGVAGNGQTELIDAITGRTRAFLGHIRIHGQDVERMTLRERRELGMAIVPEDRHEVGSAARMPAFINLSMGKHRHAPLASRGVVNRQEMRAYAAELIQRFGVAIQGPDTTVGTLSGGNLQKLIVARELAHEAGLIVVEQPTRGVDVGAIEYIHTVLLQQRVEGRAVLLVSSELPELLTLCDRILVMYEGAILADLDAASTSESEIGFYMAGGRKVA